MRSENPSGMHLNIILNPAAVWVMFFKLGVVHQCRPVSGKFRIICKVNVSRIIIEIQVDSKYLAI
jgi:hypothetical protein